MNENHLNRWRTEGFIGIFLLLISMFLILPNFTRNLMTYILFQCGFSVLILLVIYAVNSNRFLRNLEVGCLIPFMIFNVLSFHEHSLFYMMIATGFSAAFLILVIFDLLREMIYLPVINTNLIFGALIIYFLIGVLWAKVYFIENVIHPGSFLDFYGHVDFNHTLFLEAYNVQFNLVYYSFSVLTTLGLGDIVPIQNQVRSITVMEAMFGQLFVAVIITKLVSIWHQQPNSLIENQRIRISVDQENPLPIIKSQKSFE